MDKFLTFTILGLSTAAIYAVAASGLVVTYTTSGIFNFAQGAFSMMAAFTFWQVTVDWGVPPLPAFLIVVFVVAPLFGAVIERGIMRGIEGAPEVVKIVVTVSLMVGLLGLALVLWPQDQPHTVPPFFAGSSVEILGVVIGYQRLLTMAVAVAVAFGLRIVLKRTRLGTAMRAVVDDRSLLELNGGRPGRTSAMAWALGATLAALSGVLVAADQPLSAPSLTLLIINAYAVAVVGRLRSLTGAFAGAVVLGLLEAYAVGYISSSTAIGPISLQTLRPAIPAIMLFVVIVVQPEARLRAHSISRPRRPVPVPSQRLAIGGGIVLIAATAAFGSMLHTADLGLVVKAFGFAIITLSLVPLTGYAGQISLAQVTFTGIGAVAMAAWGANGSPVAVAASIIVCAVVGAVVALPALRLTGIYLALATAAFALFCTSMFFNQSGVMPGGSVSVPGVNFGFIEITNDYRQLVLFAVMFAVIGNLLVMMRRGSIGRRLTAMKDSPVACATLGLNITATKVGVFALSAAIAGAGGAMAGRTYVTDDFALTASLPVTMLAVVGGIGSIAGAFVGGILLGAFPIGSTVFAANAIGVFKIVSLSVTDVLSFTPGLIGISLGREPDGAAPQLAAGFRAVGRSRAAVAVTVVITAGLWGLAKAGAIERWGMVASLFVFLFACVPLLPVVFGSVGGADATTSPSDARRLATSAWMAVAVAIAALLPWESVTESNGFRILLLLGFTLISARVTIGMIGVAPDAVAAPAPSPDLAGIDDPISRDDALHAGRALGIDEDEFELFATPRVAPVATPARPSPFAATRSGS